MQEAISQILVLKGFFYIKLFFLETLNMDLI